MKAPDGAKKTFKISPIAATVPPHKGPKIAAVKKTEINLNGIFIAFPILSVQ